MCDEKRSPTLRVKKDLQVSDDSQILLEEQQPSSEVTIVVTQAFCPRGHNLISPDNHRFDGQPGIRLGIADGDNKGEVVLSPIHGDARKLFDISPEPRQGTKLSSIVCPFCGVELPTLGGCVIKDGGGLRGLYLTPRLSKGYAALICDVWGCSYSRVMDDWELLSEVVIMETRQER